MERALALLSPADAVRRWVLARIGRFARPYLVDRDRRVALSFGVAVLMAFGLAVSAPLHLLALGPLVLGVPHLLSDVRYLVARPGFGARRAVVLAVGLPLVLLSYTTDPRAGFAAVVGAGVVATSGSLARRAVVVALGGALLLLAHAHPRATSLVFAHMHNVVALGFFWWLRPRRRPLAWLPLALFAAVALALSLGLHERVAARLGTIDGTVLGTSIDRETWVLAPTLSSPWDARLVVVFAFAQSVHYGLWLRVIPDEARPSKTPRSFAQSARALVADVGGPVVLLAMAGAAVVAVYGLVDVYAARMRYLDFALFHGYLELAALGLFFAESRGGGPLERRPEVATR